MKCALKIIQAVVSAWLLLLTPGAFAQRAGCPAGYARFGRALPKLPKGLSPFWSQQSAPLPGYPDRYFTFSIDSEISFAQGVRLLRKIPGTDAQIRKKLGHIKLTRKELAAANKVNEQQLGFSVLRKGVRPDKAKYSLADLQPNAFMNTLYFLDTNAKMSEKYAINAWDAAEPLADVFNSVASRDKWPFRADVDGDNVEFAHRTFDKSPRTFRQNVATFEKNFGKPQTHVHVGVPAEVPKNEFFQILRALETRITLRIARENTGANLSFADSSFLAADANVGTGRRGVIKADLNEWEAPFKMRNVEIRQHFSLREAFDDVELTVTLAQNHKRLKRFPGLFPRGQPEIDPRVSNIHGALKFAAAVLEQSPEEADRKLLPELRKLVRRTAPRMKDIDQENVWRLPKDVLRDVAKFLQRTKLDERLTTEKFLK